MRDRNTWYGKFEGLGDRNDGVCEMARRMFGALLVAGVFAGCLAGYFVFTARAADAQTTCTTQSGMTDTERNGIADAARDLAMKVEENDTAGLKAETIAEVVKDFGSLQYLVAITSPKLKGTPVVDQIYLLDASKMKRNADGSAPDGQFFCARNRSTREA